jgi:hypothetical protein
MMAMSKQENRQSIRYSSGMLESSDFAQSKKKKASFQNDQLCDITTETSSAVLAMQARSKLVLRIRIYIDFSRLGQDPERNIMF